ncbi:acylneuraminate cytidylyltransferase family protein [Galbibacter sp. EGI 63066]|uniref:acylneuraminate cytidylyltransferase family protein n=1 Tax=Galbibacter sp. EGI 63066 TaxID=2993559 RepID=UPI0022490A79|nr:acylneuraminate cytidylyltransferase family protein [Galbibacter sp. EGI 63066]MCX2680679.1 acylneuraminate cytidylyltransferase family protein [Galbibacter sp. EGI 63066]
MKPLVVIPARGGSKGLPGKNIKLLNGKPLIHYTIEAARKVFDDENIIVSTDDDNIKSCAEKTGLKVPFIRPSELATDTVSTYDVLKHALTFCENQGYYPEIIVLLQPTSPFRKSTHIREALRLFDDSTDMVVSVKETKSNPYYVLFEEDKEGFLIKSKEGDFTRRQDSPKVWEYNGAIYVISVKSFKDTDSLVFKRTKKYIMDEASSVDIDSKFDWLIAESCLSVKRNL